MQSAMNIFVIISYLIITIYTFKWINTPWCWVLAACWLSSLCCLLWISPGFRDWIVNGAYKALSMNIWEV